MADTSVNGNRESFRVVGKPHLPGVLSWDQATGKAKFGSDYVVPNMLHAKFLRCPHANARIKSIDTKKAKAIPGVVEIFTSKDLQSGGGGGGGFGGGMGGFGGGGGGSISDSADQEAAEVGAIVLAESEDICEEALRQLDIEWEVLPFVVDLKEGRKPDAPVIRSAQAGGGGGRGGGGMGGFGGGGGGGQPKRGNVSFSSVNNSGDVETGFKEADHIVEYDVNTAAFSGHVPNPIGSVAWYQNDAQGGRGALHFEGDPWGGSQGVQDCKYVGGRYCDWGSRKSQQITPTLAQKTGRPVRCVNSRYDQYDFNLNQRYVHLKVGIKSNGLITAIDDFSIADGGVQGSTNFGNTMDQTYGPYYTTKCMHIRQNMEVVDSNRGKMYTSGQHNPMSWDSLMVGLYVIAEKLGKDPIDIATLNLHGPTSQTDPNPVPSYDKCVAAVKKMMNWSWHKAGAKTLPDGRMHGASFRYNQCPRHSGMQFSPTITLQEGVVHLPAKPKIIGHYGYECNMMVIAEELGLEFKDIKVDFDHSARYSPYGGGSDGSTSSSYAIKQCVNQLKTRILEAAIAEAKNPPDGADVQQPSPFKGLSPEDLDMQGGKVVVKANPSKGLPLKQAVRASLSASFNGRPPDAVWSQRGKALDVMDVATCEVAVDTETGEVEITRFGVVADPGKVLRQTSIEGQIHQVMDFSTGCQLKEEFVFDPQTGVRLSSNMFDYKKVGMLDMPRVDIQLLETRASNACYGGSGISHSLANTHLIIMAIHNAIGKWVESPATPEKVLKALGKA
jgi:CO/xanthine dehydrogenase Mo-binding subunit